MAQTNLNIPPANTPFLTQNGTISPPWYRYLVSLNTTADQASAGEIATAPGSGLQGGGAVSDGVNLSIASDGVTNAMLRPSLACSVIGRYLNSTGNPADIQATANERVLSREGNQLAFRAFINGVSIGPTNAAPLVRADGFETTQAVTVSAVTTDCTIPIVTASGTKYILLSDTAT